MKSDMQSIEWFADISSDDVAHVGGKNASLGEMYRELGSKGVRVPNGFATTAGAFREFLAHNGLEEKITEIINGWNRDDVQDLEVRTRDIRSLILAAEFSLAFRTEILDAYAELSREAGTEDVPCAVRSSATAEDLPEASFAGQQETYLMIQGGAHVLDAVRRCFASLYTARAVSYRDDMGIDQHGIALSACVQRMVRSDLSCSGVIFTLDPDSGHRDVISITSVWGLGENIVQGRVIPDTAIVHKPTLAEGFPALISTQVGAKEMRMRYEPESARIVNERTTDEERSRLCLDLDETLDLARWALAVEEHYSTKRGVPTPMDLEWAKDGVTGEIFIVQARPETVHSQRSVDALEVFHLTGEGEALVEGLAVGDRVATGPVRRILDTHDMVKLQDGDVLVTDTTDPDWEPILKRAAAVVTEQGGRTSHAAIVARELGIPAVVGAGPTEAALQDGQLVTVSCAQGATGIIYEGAVDFETEAIDLAALPETDTAIMVNLGDPDRALSNARLPSGGVGLARMEFIFASHVGVHPLALTRYDSLPTDLQRAVREKTVGFSDPTEYLVSAITQGVAMIAAAFFPRPVILRFSDFKTNEYAGLLGGEMFEPTEPNPMIGWRGASRYSHPDFQEGFELEIEAVRRVRHDLGLTNLKVMIPFCRTPAEGEAVLQVLAAGGLHQGEDDLEVYVMAEIPANVILADRFAELFDGFSIGSNDLTQLTLGVDRDSTSVAHLFDEQNEAVKRSCASVIAAGHKAGRKVGICGQAPSDHPEFAAFLVREGIDSISVTPDALPRTISRVATAEQQQRSG